MSIDVVQSVFQNNGLVFLILGISLAGYLNDIMEALPELLQQLTNYALDFGELIVNALSGISDSLQG